MNMIEYRSNYVPVDARSVIPMAEGGSGQDTGFAIEGRYINWNSETGVTGGGWTTLINAPYSPFAGMTDEDIVNAIESSPNHSLDAYFGKLSDLTNRQRDDFIDALIDKHGYTEENGCIGDPLYNI